MFLVCGEALYDVFVGSEDAGGGFGLEGRPGGSPFNVAIGMARQGVASGLLTGMSDDVFGAKLAGMLAHRPAFRLILDCGQTGGGCFCGAGRGIERSLYLA